MIALIAVLAILGAWLGYVLVREWRVATLNWPPGLEIFTLHAHVRRYLRRHGWSCSTVLGPPYRFMATKGDAAVAVFCLTSMDELHRSKLKDILGMRDIFGGRPLICVSARAVSNEMQMQAKSLNILLIHFTDLLSFARLHSAKPKAICQYFNARGYSLPYPDSKTTVVADATPAKGGEKGGAPAFFLTELLEDAQKCLRDKQPEQASEAYRAALAINPGHVGALAGLATALNQLGRTEEAITHALSATRVAPDQAGLHAQLGNLYSKAGQWVEAAAAFRSAAGCDQQNLAARTGLANALNQLGRPEEALEPAREAISIAPQNATLLVQLGNLHLTCATEAVARGEQAEAAFRGALALEPHNQAALSGLVSALNLQRKVDQALHTLNEALIRYPDHPQLRARRAQLLADNYCLGDPEILALRASIAESANDPDLHVVLGRLLLTNDAKPTQTRPDLAEAEFRKAIKLSPLHLGAIYGLASALRQQGKLTEGIALLRQAIAALADNAALHVRLGQLLEDAEDSAAARQAYGAAAGLNPGDPLAVAGLRRVRDPNEVFALIGRSLAGVDDAPGLNRLAEELGAPEALVAACLRAAETGGDIAWGGTAPTELDRHFLRAVTGARQRAEYHALHNARAPLSRKQVAPPAIDPIADQPSHEAWQPCQWISSYILRQAKKFSRAAVVTTARDEGLSLLEWVAHHRAIGFCDIFVYSNDNSDGSEALLTALADAGIITYIENRMDERHSFGPQKKAYAHALNLLPEMWEYEWALFADCDEFLVPSAELNYRVGNLLDAAGDVFGGRLPSAICFNWMWYVSGETYAYKPELLHRRFRHASRRRGMKSFVRLDDVYSMHQVHFPDTGPDGFLVRSDFSPLPRALRWKKLPPEFGGGQLNHYWNKSFEEYALKKVRGDVSSARDKLWKREFRQFFQTNEEEVPENFIPTPEPVVVAVESEIENLLSLPGVRAAQQEVISRFPNFLRANFGPGGLREVYEATRSSLPRRGRTG